MTMEFYGIQVSNELHSKRDAQEIWGTPYFGGPLRQPASGTPS